MCSMLLQPNWISPKTSWPTSASSSSVKEKREASHLCGSFKSLSCPTCPSPASTAQIFTSSYGKGPRARPGERHHPNVGPRKWSSPRRHGRGNSYEASWPTLAAVAGRQSYWDMAYDADVMDNRVGLNLLYAQTVADVERGWILVNKDQRRQLKSLQEKGSKKEFIHLGQTLKYYGYVKFDPCATDFPEQGCQVMVGAGNNELNFHVKLPNHQMKEGSFKVTRMRCWRVTSSQVPIANGADGPSPSAKCDVKLELAFEYLMSKDRLRWVTISSQQAIMMSICLQSMVDELMVKKSGGGIKKMLRKRHNGTGTARGPDGQQAVKSPPLLDSPEQSCEQIIKLSTKLSSASLRGTGGSNPAGDAAAGHFHGNYAFEGIGDEDL
ncbi:sorting nexin-17 isoform X3 [Syngnathoides biaculeatus]|uniref:sorting nexin-17 isoform X3 n=1 Tax=Syngnathoides biaculeatus TaxID=300417 RepID=UPI002ADE4D1E|nr:sorting nexin-17 isoform X3 [Syngnathoides biaculeatus]